MRVYHFIPTEFALQNLQNRRLKIAQINDLNDPFELIAANISDREQRKILSGWRKSFEKKWGVLCFSKTWRNPVLWSHYADRHKGMCLGFEVADEHLMHVKYSKKRLNINFEALYDQGQLNQKTMTRMLSTKFHDWRYEKEARIFATLDVVDSETGLYFSDFTDTMKLTDIIAGPLCNISSETIRTCIQETNSNVKVIKSRLAFTEFKVVENKQGFKK